MDSESPWAYHFVVLFLFLFKKLPLALFGGGWKGLMGGQFFLSWYVLGQIGAQISKKRFEGAVNIIEELWSLGNSLSFCEHLSS